MLEQDNHSSQQDDTLDNTKHFTSSINANSTNLDNSTFNNLSYA